MRTAMFPPADANRTTRRPTALRWARGAIAGALAMALLPACSSTCPPGTTKQGGWCHRDTDAAIDGAGANAGDTARSGTSAMSNGVQAAGGSPSSGTGGAGQSKPPPIDPTVEWMCMKNAGGECTSCKQDADCPKHVCEQGYCMDCRQSSQCPAANSCISNRCVPERKPSNIWTTSGGGLTTAPGFKLQVSMGTPAPAANTSATGFKVSVAPGAGSF